MADFPSLTFQEPGVTREILYRTSVFTSPGGKEQRIQWASSARYRYRFSAHVTSSDLSTIQTLYGAHYGALSTFTYVDPISGSTVTVRFEDDSLVVKKVSSDVWHIDFALIQVI